MPHMAGASKEDKELHVPRVSMDYFFMSDEDFKASENPLIVMVDEGTGEKYARATGRKGLASDGSMDWLVKDMVAELKSGVMQEEKAKKDESQGKRKLRRR